MDYKKTNAAETTITRNLTELEQETENIYETIAIISRRANQIGDESLTEDPDKHRLP